LTNWTNRDHIDGLECAASNGILFFKFGGFMPLGFSSKLLAQKNKSESFPTTIKYQSKPLNLPLLKNN
jgi:hypothetical protein